VVETYFMYVVVVVSLVILVVVLQEVSVRVAATLFPKARQLI